MTIQEILEAHESRGASSRYGVAVVSCGCKEVFHGPDSHDAKATHRAHVAQVLEQHELEREAKALEGAAENLEKHPRLRKSQFAWLLYPETMRLTKKTFSECAQILRDRAEKIRKETRVE